MIHEEQNQQLHHFRSECSQCSGLCCTALFFSKIDGFPENKKAGVPCKNLEKDYTCRIHEHLAKDNMRGCISYDCFGAGQQVTQTIYHGQSWNGNKEQAQEIFAVFHVVSQMHQIRYYLVEAASLTAAYEVREQLAEYIVENQKVCSATPKEVLSYDVEAHRDRVNAVLKQAYQLVQKSLHTETKKCPENLIGKKFVNQDLSGLDFSVKLLIAANMKGCVFGGTSFLGADTRDTDFSDADLSQAVFLSQGQVNAAKGNKKTKLPKHLSYPVTWR